MGKSSVTKKFSQVSSELKGLLREALEVPPEKPLPEKEAMDESPSEAPEKELAKEVEEVHHVDDSQEVLAQLNNATSLWKETGDLQVHLEPPVPFRTRIKETFHHLKEKNAPGFHHVQNMTKSLMKRFRKNPDIVIAQPEEHLLPSVQVTPELRSQEIPAKPTQIEQEILNDWMVVLENGEIASDMDRKEIENLYHELSVKN